MTLGVKSSKKIMPNDTQSKTTHLDERLYTPSVRVPEVVGELLEQKTGKVICHEINH